MNNKNKGLFPEIPISQWVIESGILQMDNENLFFVITTTCVVYGEVELRKSLRGIRNSLGKKDVWLLPEDVFYELSLLARKSHFREIQNSARFLLKNSRKVKWHMSWLNSKNSAIHSVGNDFYDNMIFLFGDMIHLEQFVLYADETLGDYRVIYGTPELGNIADFALMDVALCRKIIEEKRSRRLKMDDYESEKIQLLSDDPIHMINGDGEDSFVWNPKTWENFEIQKDEDGDDLAGAYGRIASLSEKPFHYYKIFRKKPTPFLEHKLECLMRIQKHCNLSAVDFPVSFPARLLYKMKEGTKELIGYEMKRFSGQAMQDLNLVGSEEDIFTGLILVLLELHCLHLFPKDFCMENCLVTENRDVVFIDSDGFQLGTECGKTNVHRQYVIDYIASDDQTVFFEEFILAMILASVAMGCESNQVFIERRGKKIFRMDFIQKQGVNDQEDEIHVNNWNTLSKKQAHYFVDTLKLLDIEIGGQLLQCSYHIHSMGEWIEAFSL